jgi:hypothetical protein
MFSEVEFLISIGIEFHTTDIGRLPFNGLTGQTWILSSVSMEKSGL